MSEPTMRRMLLSVAAVLLSIAPRPAEAQDPFDLPADFLVKRFDEWRLERDEARLQRDLSQGNGGRVNRDLNHIRMDEWRLWYDRARIRRDMFLPEGPWASPGPRIPRGATLVPRPQYPGYGYDPLNPNQVSALPQQPSAMAPAISGGGPVAAGLVSVAIGNAGPAGTAIDYVVDGVAYRTASGQVQPLAVLPTATIRYNRGGGLGEQRYGLAEGRYQFQANDNGWNLYRLPPQQAASRPPTVVVPRNELPRLSAAPRPDEAARSEAGPVEVKPIP